MVKPVSPEMKVEWSMTLVDARDTWTLKLYEDGSLVVQHNEHALRVNSSGIMELVDAFCVLFGLNKRGL